LDIHPTDGVFFMTKHSESFKLEVVQKVLADSAPLRITPASGRPL
jgi:hypothetical protein